MKKFDYVTKKAKMILPTFDISVSHVFTVLLARLLQIFVGLRLNIRLSARPSLPGHDHLDPSLAVLDVATL